LQVVYKSDVARSTRQLMLIKNIWFISAWFTQTPIALKLPSAHIFEDFLKA